MKYSDYLSEDLTNSYIEYTEYIAENLTSYDYTDYLSDQLDKTISYTEYISENLSSNVEEIKRKKKVKFREDRLDQILNKKP